MSEQTQSVATREVNVPRIALSINEAAEALSLSPRTMEQLARDGRVPAFRIGRRWLFSVEALRRWADEESSGQHDDGNSREVL